MYKKVILCCIYTLSIFASHSYNEQARIWIQNYIANEKISEHDLHVLANLLYFSYMRSATSLSAQKSALALMTISWQHWQNIAQTRMDPAHPLPYQSICLEDNKLMLTCIEHQQLYEHINKQYVAITDLVLKKNVVNSKIVNAGIKKMREQARTVIASALIDLKTHIHTLTDQLTHFIAPKRKKALPTKNMITNVVMKYIPALGMKSFIEVEKNTHFLSADCWKILSSIQALNGYIWTVLETERAALYHAYYDELWKALEKSNQHKTIFIEVDTQKKLPRPREL